MSSRIPTFGFARWDRYPHRAESTLGFYLRMVEREGEDSFRRFSYMNGMRDTQHDQEEILHFLERHPYPEHVKEHFRRSVFYRDSEKAKYNPRRYTVRGETLNREDVNFRSRRWCRACLAEDSYRRLWFDVVAIRRCPYHGDHIENRLRSGRAIAFYRTGFHEVFEEGIAAKAGKLDEGSFEHYLLGRLDCEDGFSVPIFDSVPLSEVIDACENVGMLFAHGYLKKFPAQCGVSDADVGFQTIRQGGAHLAKRLLDWAVANVPRDIRRRDTDSIFSWLYRRNTTVMRGPLNDLIVKAMHVVNAALKGSPREITDEYVASDVIALDKVADELGIDRIDFSKMVKALGLIEPGPNQRRRGMAVCDVPKVVAFFDGLLDQVALGEMLGMVGYEVFVKAGHLRMYRAVGQGRKGPRFLKEDADRIIEAIHSTQVTGRTDIARTFHSAAKHKWGQRKLALRVLSGKTKVAGVRNRGKGFAKLLVEVDDTRRAKPFRNGGNEIMAIEASRILGIPSRGLSLLVEAGTLSPTLNDRGKRVFKRTEVEGFLTSHIKQSVAAKKLNQYGKFFAADLRTKGVEAAVILALGKREVRFHDTSVLAAAYNVSADVFDPRSAELDRFWASLLDVALAVAPGLRLPTTFPADGCWGGTSVRQGAVRFIFDPKREVLVATLAPIKTSGICFEFNVHDNADHKLLGGLFDAIDRVNDVAKAHQAKSAVVYRAKTRARHRELASKRRERRRASKTTE